MPEEPIEIEFGFEPIEIEIEFGLEDFHKMVGQILTMKSFTLQQEGCSVTFKLLPQD